MRILGGIGTPELIIILIVVLLIFGPKNLPKLGSALGRTVKNLREGMNNAPEVKFDDEEESKDSESKDNKAKDEESE